MTGISKTPMNTIIRMKDSTTRISVQSNHERLKFRASFASDAAKGMVSFFTCQMISGPTMFPIPPVNSPVRADK